jgi:hypothetical protein
MFAKKIMKNLFIIFSLALLLISCKEKGNKDLTQLIVGEYAFTRENSFGFLVSGVITVEKATNKLVKINIVETINTQITTFAFINTELTSETSFVLSQHSRRSSPITLTLGNTCYVEYVYTGSGTNSDSQIFIDIKQTTRKPVSNPCPENMSIYNSREDYTIVGTRQ